MKKQEEAIQKLNEALDRWGEAVYPSREALDKELAKGRKLTLYLGFDPTSPHLHFGHAIPLFVLKAFQQAGHKVIVLIGDFTAQIGDPTDKLAPRQPLIPAQVKTNYKTFKKQIAKIISFTGKNAATVRFNSKWLSKMSFADVVRLSQNVTVQQMIERDMFQERLKAGKPIGVHEFLYPLMQGYDSIAMDVDLEVGGNDQTFNMLMGRTLMKILKNKEKFVVTARLLVNPVSGKKVGKTEGGLIDLDASATDIFGKVMALSDEIMFVFAKLCTEMPLEVLGKLQKAVVAGNMNPRDAKLEVAKAATSLIYGAVIAEKEKQRFLAAFSKRSEALREVDLRDRTMTAVDVVKLLTNIKSNSEAWRLIQQGGFEIDGKKITDPKQKQKFSEGQMIRTGKHLSFRVR